MDTKTLPEIIIPDLKMDLEEYLLDEDTIRVGQDIPDADVIIDKLIYDLKKDEEDATWLFAVKEFTHIEKVNWILSLPDRNPETGCQGEMVYVNLYITIMVMVAISAAGEPLYGKKMLTTLLQKCVPVKQRQQ